MKIILTILLLLTFSVSAEEKKKSVENLVCSAIRVQGDDSKFANFIELATGPSAPGSAGLLFCQNSVSVCYILSGAISCHKK